jgi:hypothetical protein
MDKRTAGNIETAFTNPLQNKGSARDLSDAEPRRSAHYPEAFH